MKQLRKRGWLSSLACLSVLVALAGCGGSAIVTEGVSGTVTLDGTPLADATVNFSPVTPGQGSPSFGKTDANGHYVLQTLLGEADAGTTPGDYAVTVSKIELTPVGEPVKNIDGSVQQDTKGTELVPQKYTSAATSGLTAKVVEGDNTFDFALTSK